MGCVVALAGASWRNGVGGSDEGEKIVMSSAEGRKKLQKTDGWRSNFGNFFLLRLQAEIFRRIFENPDTTQAIKQHCVAVPHACRSRGAGLCLVRRDACVAAAS